MSVENAKKKDLSTTMVDFALLAIAIIIDVADLLPLEVIGFGFIYELPVAAIEMLFLAMIGVPAFKAIGQGVWDIIPVLDIMPWCTLAVLDRRFGIRLSWITALFNSGTKTD